MATRTCTKCGETKSAEEFSRNRRNKSGYSFWCRPCTREYCRLYYQKHQERLRKRGTDWNRKNKRQIRNAQLKRCFGITIEQYDMMYKNQEGCCAICRKHRNKFKRRLHVHHDHKTGWIGGLLCHGCNTGLGSFEDKKDLLIKAIHFLGQQKRGVR